MIGEVRKSSYASRSVIGQRKHLTQLERTVAGPHSCASVALRRRLGKL